MNHLDISLLGPFRVTLNGNPVIQFEADTARALLAYLVVDAETPYRREVLAGLLWPDQSEAMTNLGYALVELGQRISGWVGATGRDGAAPSRMNGGRD